MTIHVVHGDSCFEASVVYNFNQVLNIIILKFDKPVINNEKDMILWYNPRSDEWNDLSGLHKKYPELFRQIEYKLKQVIRENNKLFYSEDFIYE